MGTILLWRGSRRIGSFDWSSRAQLAHRWRTRLRSVELTLLDGKQVELIAWSDVADEFVGADQEAAVAALEGLLDVMDDRYALLAHNRRRKMTAEDLDGLFATTPDTKK